MSILGKRKQYEQYDDQFVEPHSKRHKSGMNGHHKPRAPDNYLYRDLEVVWARLEDFPWWPAQCDFTLLDRDHGKNKTPRLPVRWFGEDHNRVDWLTRDRIIPFSLDIEAALLNELKVEEEDQPEYNASIEDAVLRQKKWKKNIEKERRRNETDSDDPDFDPSAYKRSRKVRRSSRRHQDSTPTEDDDDDEDGSDDEDEDNFEVDENGLIIDPAERAKQETRKRRQHNRRRSNDPMMADESDIDRMDRYNTRGDEEKSVTDDEEQQQHLELFDDVGDVEKGYVDTNGANQFVVLQNDKFLERQQRERLLQQQQQQELQRQQLLAQQQAQMVTGVQSQMITGVSGAIQTQMTSNVNVGNVGNVGNVQAQQQYLLQQQHHSHNSHPQQLVNSHLNQGHGHNSVNSHSHNSHPHGHQGTLSHHHSMGNQMVTGVTGVSGVQSQVQQVQPQQVAQVQYQQQPQSGTGYNMMSYNGVQQFPDNHHNHNHANHQSHGNHQNHNNVTFNHNGNGREVRDTRDVNGYYPPPQQPQDIQQAVMSQDIQSQGNGAIHVGGTSHDGTVFVPSEVAHVQSAETIHQPPPPQHHESPVMVPQPVPTKTKRKRSQRNKKRKHEEIESQPVVHVEPEPILPKVRLEDILKDTQHVTKLKKIADEFQQQKQSGLLANRDKKRILKGLPYQLQQEIMQDGYRNTTPNILKQYLEHQQKIGKMTKEERQQHEQLEPYYPDHFNRMRIKAKKDRRWQNPTIPTRKRHIRGPSTSNTPDGKSPGKKAPAYLRVASPEVLEKMQFSKNARNALTLDHIVTKQYRNRGRKSGFFGRKRRGAKQSSTTPKTPKSEPAIKPESVPKDPVKVDAVPNEPESTNNDQQNVVAETQPVATSNTSKASTESTTSPTKSNSPSTAIVIDSDDIQPPTELPMSQQLQSAPPLHRRKSEAKVEEPVVEPPPTVQSITEEIEATEITEITETNEQTISLNDEQPADEQKQDSLEPLPVDAPVIETAEPNDDVDVVAEQTETVETTDPDPEPEPEPEPEQVVTEIATSTVEKTDDIAIEAQPVENTQESAPTEQNVNQNVENQEINTVDGQQVESEEKKDSEDEAARKRAAMQRMWTKTNLETGEKENRLRRKNTVEMIQIAKDNLDVSMTDTSGADDSGDKKVDDADDADNVGMETTEQKEEKMSPQRMWTKTNVLTGMKEDRLHRKDTMELGLKEHMDQDEMDQQQKPGDVEMTTTVQTDDVPLDNMPQSNVQTESEQLKPTKLSPQRMWTKTNVLTGEQEGRLHRKDTVELGLTNSADPLKESEDVDMLATEQSANVQEQSTNLQEEQDKPSPQRMWTKTNVLTGEKDQRLHRKDNDMEIPLNARDVESMDGNKAQDEGVDLDAMDEDDDVNDGVIDTMSQVY